MDCSVKLLIADDDQLNRMMLGKLMQRFNVNSVMAKDGRDTMELFKQDTYDAVFLDVNMPFLTGPECADMIRQHCIKTGIECPRLVCISADDDYHGSDIFDSFLAKPFVLENIKSLIDSIFASKCCVLDYDIEKAAEIIGLDKETMLMLADEFISVFDEEIINLEKAINDSSPDMITHVAHKMKGAAANMQIEKLKDLCAEMQKSGKDEPDRLKRLFDGISCAYCSFKKVYNT